MSNTAEETKPVPRAERHPVIPDGWDIHDGRFILTSKEEKLREADPYSQLTPRISPGHALALIESAKLREALEGSEAGRLAGEQKLATKEGVLAELRNTVVKDGMCIQDLVRNGNRVATALGLPEGAGVDEVLAAVEAGGAELARTRNRLDNCIIHKEKLRDFRDTIHRLADMKRPVDDQELIRLLQQNGIDRKEALEQLSNLGQFIGHPGATPAHVVSETVSLVEKFLKIADLTGCKMDQAATGVAESFKARMTEARDVTVPAREKFAEFLGSKSEKWSQLSETATEKIEYLRRQEGYQQEGRIQAIREAGEWKQRALAAEAQLAGGPDEKSESQHFKNRMQSLRDQLGVAPGLSDAGALLVAVNTIEKLRGGPDEEPTALELMHKADEVIDALNRREGGCVAKESERLQALRDDTNLDKEVRRQASIAYETLVWVGIETPACCAPSVCLERGVFLLKEDEEEYHQAMQESGNVPCGNSGPPLGFVASGAFRNRVFLKADGTEALPEDPVVMIDEGITALLGCREVLGSTGNVQHAIDCLTKLRGRTASETPWHEKVAEQLTEIKELTKFRRVVCRLHGIPNSVPNEDAFATIAEYLDCAEKWRKAARGHHPEDLDAPV